MWKFQLCQFSVIIFICNYLLKNLVGSISEKTKQTSSLNQHSPDQAGNKDEWTKASHLWTCSFFVPYLSCISWPLFLHPVGRQSWPTPVVTSRFHVHHSGNLFIKEFGQIPSTFTVYDCIPICAYIIFDAFTFTGASYDHIICNSKAQNEWLGISREAWTLLWRCCVIGGVNTLDIVCKSNSPCHLCKQVAL